MKGKLLILLLFICMFIMMLNTVAFEKTHEVLTTSNNIIYIDVSVDSNSEQDGSSEKPYYDIADAIYAAKDGDTIIIKSNVGYANDLTSGDLGENAPLIIDKRVTIQGEGDSMPSLNVRRGEIILAEDVTFRNFNFNYTNSIGRIFANGHSLTLENIGYNRGTKIIDIFGGSLSGQTADYGNKSEIIVTGKNTNIGDIFAGSQGEDWTQDVDITIQGNVSSIGTIYAAGKGSNSSGDVSITLNNSNVRNVDGKQGESILKNASVSVSVEGTNDLISFEHLGRLELISGKLKPKALNENIEIKIHSECSLDLSTVTKTDSSFEIKRLHGEEGSILYTNKDSCINIIESFIGNIEFRTVNNAALIQDESGLVDLNHIYINAENATEKLGIFTFVPHLTQKDKVTLTNIHGKWTAMATGERNITTSVIDTTVPTDKKYVSDPVTHSTVPTDKKDVPDPVTHSTVPTDKKDVPDPVTHSTVPTDKKDVPDPVTHSTVPTDKKDVSDPVTHSTVPTDKKDVPDPVTHSTVPTDKKDVPDPVTHSTVPTDKKDVPDPVTHSTVPTDKKDVPDPVTHSTVPTDKKDVPDPVTHSTVPTDKKDVPDPVTHSTVPTDKKDVPDPVTHSTVPTDKKDVPDPVTHSTVPTDKKDVPDPVTHSTVPTDKKDVPDPAIDLTVPMKEKGLLSKKNSILKDSSNFESFKTTQNVSRSDKTSVEGYDNLREVLKNQILPQSVNAFIKTFPSTFKYLDKSDIGIGLNLYSGSWLPNSHPLSSAVAYVQMSYLFNEVNDRIVIDLYYTLGVNYDMLSFNNNATGELTPNSRKNLESTLAHELMHAMMYESLTSGMLGISQNNPRGDSTKMFPNWFIEGTAQAAGGGANAVRKGLGITADLEESDIKAKLQRYYLNKGNVYANYGTGYLATMYLGYLMNGENSVKKEDISNGLDKFLNEIRGGKSLNKAITENTKYLSISDFENNFASDAARFTKKLMNEIGNDGFGALIAASYQDTDILDDNAININVFNLNTQYNRVLNIYPKDFVVMSGGQKETDGVAWPEYSNIKNALSNDG
ncbi:hypothetical protein JCM1393_12950 [Clostridium carnis]